MQVARIRLCRAARAVQTVVKPSGNSQISTYQEESKIATASSSSATVRRVTDKVGSSVNKVFAGSSTGTAYRADSPILGKALYEGEADRPPPPDPIVSKPSTAAPPRELSLAELKGLPAADLQRMLAERGVSRCTATEKEDLAKWVHSHQGLPVVRPGAEHKAPVVKRSVAELEKLSVKELKEILAERGAPEGSATEKSELARWVYAHQDLPVLYDWRERQKQRQKGRWGYGPGGEPYDTPPEAEKPDQKLLEAEEEAKRLEGEEAKLLEGGSTEEEKPSINWKPLLWALGIVSSLGVLLIGVVALDNSRTSGSTDNNTEEKGSKTSGKCQA
eukprot:TRINITY_DN34222_c0_g1_i1.p1 TRINITY_DN34222_c0_g1~~TRINITY_DN34222_c0_g1_i1.p1  ORF type:complete len:332 (+),score=77.58 TRINITY_DN34222_c0_g1_i1:139-1134(+)